MSSSQPVSEISQSRTTPISATTNTEPIERFLGSLPQDLRILLPIFVANGVKDEPSLRGMLRMEGWQRWIYSWVRTGQLTELQYVMIVASLAKVV